MSWTSPLSIRRTLGDPSDTSLSSVMIIHRHEDEANEKRKKRFAREHDIEESRGRGIAPVVHGLGDLSIVAKRGGKKTFASLGYAVEEPEPMFDPVSTR